jgi:serine/threonine protein kinase
MVNGKPTFTGTTEESQLETIFRQLGNPEPSFPQIAELPGWKAEYAAMQTKNHATAVEAVVLNKELGEAGVDLLMKMLIYDPAKRISAQDARNHAYFDDLPDSLKNVGAI